MKLSKSAAARNRHLIIDAAGRLFRERGVDAVAVAEVMAAAGFTHGGFYNHFPSKEALAVEACDAAFEQSVDRLREALAADPGAPSAVMADYIDRYLSVSHRDNVGDSCPTASLAADAARQGTRMQTAFADGVDGMLTTLAQVSSRRQAMRLLSEIVGALILARAVAGASPALSEEILDASRIALTSGS